MVHLFLSRAGWPDNHVDGSHCGIGCNRRGIPICSSDSAALDGSGPYLISKRLGWLVMGPRPAAIFPRNEPWPISMSKHRVDRRSKCGDLLAHQQYERADDWRRNWVKIVGFVMQN